MACPSYFIVHSPCTRDAPTYTKLKWLIHRILSFILRAHATLQRMQNLNGLSIVFYRSHSAHTQRSDVYIDYRQVWGSLRLAPIRYNTVLAVHSIITHVAPETGWQNVAIATCHVMITLSQHYDNV